MGNKYNVCMDKNARLWQLSAKYIYRSDHIIQGRCIQVRLYLPWTVEGKLIPNVHTFNSCKAAVVKPVFFHVQINKRVSIVWQLCFSMATILQRAENLKFAIWIFELHFLFSSFLGAFWCSWFLFFFKSKIVDISARNLLFVAFTLIAQPLSPPLYSPYAWRYYSCI